MKSMIIAVGLVAIVIVAAVLVAVTVAPPASGTDGDNNRPSGNVSVMPPLEAGTALMINNLTFGERSGVSLSGKGQYINLNATQADFYKLRFQYCNGGPDPVAVTARIYTADASGHPATLVNSSSQFVAPVTGEAKWAFLDSPAFNTTLQVGTSYCFVLDVPSGGISIMVTQDLDGNANMTLKDSMGYNHDGTWLRAFDYAQDTFVADIMPIMRDA
mgnify:CR=1 FL=1